MGPHALAGIFSKWKVYLAAACNSQSIEAGQAQEYLNILNIARYRPFTDRFDFVK